jgi:hypothetical protein
MKSRCGQLLTLSIYYWLMNIVVIVGAVEMWITSTLKNYPAKNNLVPGSLSVFGFGTRAGSLLPALWINCSAKEKPADKGRRIIFW